MQTDGQLIYDVQTTLCTRSSSAAKLLKAFSRLGLGSGQRGLG